MHHLRSTLCAPNGGTLLMLHESNSAEAFYDKFASTYDAATAYPAWKPPRHIVNELTKIKKLFKTAFVIGVGTGQDIEALAAYNIYHLEGIDLSESMINIARQKYPLTLFHHSDFIAFKGFRLNQYDMIICSGVLEFIPFFAEFF